jgi:hypothetical protein
MIGSRIANLVMNLAGRVLFKPILYTAVGVSMLFEGYQLFGPAEDSLGFMRRNLAQRVCAKAADELPRRNGIPSIAVLDLAGDVQGLVTNLLRDRIAATGEFHLMEEPFLRKLLREFGKDGAPITRLADAVATARETGVDMIVFGEIPEFAVRQDSAALKLELRMAERASGQAIFARSYFESVGGGGLASSYWRARIADSSKGRRIFIWVAFTLLLPLVSFPLIRRLLSEDSNLLNLVLLLAYTIVDMLFALLLTGFWIPTVWTAGILVLALAASGYYNYRIAAMVDRLSH